MQRGKLPNGFERINIADFGKTVMTDQDNSQLAESIVSQGLLLIVEADAWKWDSKVYIVRDREEKRPTQQPSYPPQHPRHTAMAPCIEILKFTATDAYKADPSILDDVFKIVSQASGCIAYVSKPSISSLEPL